MLHPSEKPSCFPSASFSHLKSFTVFLSVNPPPAPLQCGKGPLLKGWGCVSFTVEFAVSLGLS